MMGQLHAGSVRDHGQHDSPALHMISEVNPDGDSSSFGHSGPVGGM